MMRPREREEGHHAVVHGAGRRRRDRRLGTWVSAAESGVWLSVGNDLSIWADAAGVWVRKREPFLSKVRPDGSIGLVVSAPFQTGGDVIGTGDDIWTTAINERLVIRLRVPPET
jgi:hypothetical protein